MKNTPDALESLLEILCSGSPRAAYHAGKSLIGFGRAAEAPLIQLLRESKDALQQREILWLLQAIKIVSPTSVEVVVRLLSHAQPLVRSAAAHCLLHSSPKLRRFLPQIRAVYHQETDLSLREVLQKILDRYPKQKSSSA